MDFKAEVYGYEWPVRLLMLITHQKTNLLARRKLKRWHYRYSTSNFFEGQKKSSQSALTAAET